MNLTNFQTYLVVPHSVVKSAPQRGGGKKVGINYRNETCVFQFKMNSTIYFRESVAK